MYFEFNEEQKMFREAVRDFGEKEIAPIVDEAEKNETCPVEVFSKLGKLGYLCPAYPTEYGGGELGEVGACIMVEELAKICAGIVTGPMVHAGIATFPIVAHGSEEQKQKFLVPACAGEKIAAYGLTEANAGSDAAAVETTAKRDGDHYIINGSKLYITNGQICDFVTLAVSTDRSKGARGISTIIMGRDTPGFSTTKMSKLGHHSASTAELAFEDCRVPADNLIGEEGRGFRYMLEALNPARISHSARSIGQAQAALDASINYAKERQQFGQRIANFQAIQWMLADMATQIEAARVLTYYAADLQDKGLPFIKESAMAKLFASEVSSFVTNKALQIHGGYGYIKDYPLERYLRDAKLTEIYEGTSEMMRMTIARALVGKG